MTSPLNASVSEAVLVEDLFEWVEYLRFDVFKQRVLAPLHRARLVEWDRDGETVQISPTGAPVAEEGLLQPSTLKVGCPA